MAVRRTGSDRPRRFDLDSIQNFCDNSLVHTKHLNVYRYLLKRRRLSPLRTVCDMIVCANFGCEVLVALLLFKKNIFF